MKSKNSLYVLACLAWSYLIWHLTTIPDFHPANDSTLSWILSNGGHFFFFGVLAILIKLSISTIYDLQSITLTSLYGILIEFVQRGIPGRSFSLEDWALDTLGALTFLAIMKKYLIHES